MSEDYTQRQLAINYAVFAFALSTTVARLYTRGCLMRQLGLEDAFITFAIVAEIGLLILYRQVIIELTRIMAIVQGDSNSTSAMSPHASRLAFVLKIAYFNSLLYPIAFSLIKLSILAFYYRFLVRQKVRYILCALAGYTITFTTCIMMALLSLCTPTTIDWNVLSMNGHCSVGPVTLQLGNSIFNLISDVILVALPVPIVLRLQANLRKKVGFAFIFLLGVLGTVATIVHLAKAVQLVSSYDENMLKGALGASDLVFWSQIELNLGAVCANLPLLTDLLKILRQRRNESSDATISSRITSRVLDLSGRRLNGTVTTVMGGLPTSSEEHILPHNEIMLSTEVNVEVESAPICLSSL